MKKFLLTGFSNIDNVYAGNQKIMQKWWQLIAETVSWNKKASGPWVAHLRMFVHKVREKHHEAHKTALVMDLTALSIWLNQQEDFIHVTHYKPM